MGCACPITEPQGLGWSGYVLGVNPPGGKGDERAARRAADNLLEAHRLATPAIKAHTKAPIGVTLAIPDLQYEDGAKPGRSGFEVESEINDQFFELARADDFIGVQTYTRIRIGREGPRSPAADWSAVSRELAETDWVTQMGYEYCPRALGGAIRRAWQSTGGVVPLLGAEDRVAPMHAGRGVALIAPALD